MLGRRRARSSAHRHIFRWAFEHSRRYRLRSFGSEDAAAHLVELDALEQSLEIALAEALVALALDDFEEDRADHVLGEDLQQQALTFRGRAVHQNAALLELGDALLMALDALRQHLVISVRRIL